MEISKNDRLVNYVIDSIAIGLLTYIVSLIESMYEIYWLPFLIYFSYYFIFELTLNRTLGKLVSKTVVRSTKNKRPTILHIFARTILRFVPFDLFSYLMGNEQGIHDVLSKTRLVKTNSDK